MGLAASNRVSSDGAAADRCFPPGTAPAPVRFDDEALVRRFHDGDGAALGPLIEKYQDRVFRTCLRLCGNPDDAADLTQDVFVRVFETLKGFAGRSGFYTWLFRIAVNMSISHRRKAHTRRTTSLDAPRAGPDGSPGDSAAQSLAAASAPPDRASADRERCNAVSAALADLDDEHRTILVLRDVEDFDYGEVAEILEVPVGTVKSRLHRARMALKAKLESA